MKSTKMDLEKTKELTIKLYSIRRNKHSLSYHLVKLIILVVLFATVAFMKCGKYIIIEDYEVNIISSEDNKSLQNVNLELINASIVSINNEKFEYDIIIEETVFKIPEPVQCDNIPFEWRFDCHPEDGISESSCTKRGCCWNPQFYKWNRQTNKGEPPLNYPFCYYPKNWSLYKYENYSQSGNDFSGFLKNINSSYYKNDLPFIKLESSPIDDSILHVKMYDPIKKRYEPKWPLRSDSKLSSQETANAKYKFNMDNTKPGFKVQRTSDDTIIFDSIGIGGFVFSDQFLQISGLLPSHNIYGIGEHQTSLKLNTDWQMFTLFNKDQPPSENANLYGSHPFYLIMENSGKSHGVLFLNSNAMDVILQPSPAITFRTIGGIFDMYFFLGPSPADVIRQYSAIVGKPFFPPYWSLGFHLCRYGYGSLKKTKEVWNRTIAAGIPFDTQWNDLDYMDNNNVFTYNPNKFKDLPQFVKEIHSRGMHYIPLIDAGISGSEINGTYPPYDEGLKEGVLIKDEATNQPFFGKVWNFVSTVWPDFTNPKTEDYYLRMMSNIYNSFMFDGAWIDMNEPSNFYDGLKNGCTRNKLDYPPYVPNVLGGKLATKTVCMNAKHYLGSHYDIHNTYGTTQAIVTSNVLKKIRQKRAFVISRSTWAGFGHYAGHWTGDVYSTWHDLKMSIPAMLSFGFYQVPMVGADICGFNGNTTASLCNRWMQLGAFYPFSRNHNSDDTIEQDPVAMGDLVVKSSKHALTIRYWLLPYLYTLFFRAHQFGETVARPLFFEFPKESSTYDIDTQFMWGSSLMIIPVLEENKVETTAYLPRGIWYNIYTKEPLYAMGLHYTLDAPLDTIPLMIRGGSILPAQKPAETTTSSRKNNFELLVALDYAKMAKGELYWDDGDSLDSFEKGQFTWLYFTVKNNTLSSSKAEETSYNEKMILDKIQVWGITSNISRVFLNNREVQFEYDSKKDCLMVNNLQVDLREKFSLSWIYSK